MIVEKTYVSLNNIKL